MSTATSNPPDCPQCSGANTYADGLLFICPDCGQEFSARAHAEAADAPVKDAYGNVLVDGDAVILVKDLKVKGSNITLKMGTKIRQIRIKSGDHEIDCKVDGVGMMLKAMYLKKA
jgi:protein PhnA